MANTPQVWTVLSIMEWATTFFKNKKVSQPRLSIEWLLAHVLHTKRLDLYLKYDRPLTDKELNELRPMVKRRALHEPLQYITGSTQFYNLEIKVTPDVLIPRPETEQLVELILTDLPEGSQKTCIDLGTGSGCIPIALKKNRPAWQLSGIDISSDALLVAQKNANLNKTPVDFFQYDMLSKGSEFPDKKYDIIVSNPPYIIEEERSSLEKEVRDYEPEIALFCKDIEEMFSAILKFSIKYLKTEGTIYLEINPLTSASLLKLFETNNFSTELINDYDGKARFLKSCRNHA